MEKVAIAPARVMRLIWFGFVLSGVMIIYVAITIPVPAPRPENPAFEIAITVLALANVVLGFFAPRLLTLLAAREPGNRAESGALNRWLSRNMVSLAFTYSCVLFAFVLHMIRARNGLVELLFGVGMMSLLLWRPETPPAVESRNLPQR